MTKRGSHDVIRLTPLLRSAPRPGSGVGGTMIPFTGTPDGGIWAMLRIYNIELDETDPAQREYAIGGFLPHDAVVDPFDPGGDDEYALLGTAAVGYTWDATQVAYTRDVSSGTNSDNVATVTAGVPWNASFLYAFDGTNFDRLRAIAAADGTTNPSVGALTTLDFNMFWNGTTWDRARSGASNTDDVTTATTGVQQTLSFTMGFDGATWDRIRSFAFNADAVAAPTLGLLGEAAFLFGYNGTTCDRLRSFANNADDVASVTAGLLGVFGFNAYYDGTNWDRQRGVGGASFVNLAGSNTDRSSTIAVGGTSQQLMASNTSRKGGYVQNLSTTANLGIRFGASAAAIGSAGTITVFPGAIVTFQITEAVQIVGPTGGQAFTAGETS